MKQWIKCKGCTGSVAYETLAMVKERGGDYFNAGPALAHDPPPGCQWFHDTSAQQIVAYINVAEYKTKNQLSDRSTNQ